MKVVVKHKSTQQATMPVMDQALTQLLAGAVGSSIQIVDQKKQWNGRVMTYSFTGRMGFISAPLSGTIEVDETLVTVEMELPPIVKTFVGEARIHAIVEENVRELLDSRSADSV